MRAVAVIPAYQASATIAAVCEPLLRSGAFSEGVIVVDDGSTDDTAAVARSLGASVLGHPQNRGKGAALRTGLAEAERRGAAVAVTLDADAQHPPEEALRLLRQHADADTLVLGVRDLVRAGAPRLNRFSNALSNYFLSRFSGLSLGDTQCGLRCYPVLASAALETRGEGFTFEAEYLLRAAAGSIPIVQVPVRVHYPPGELRVSHFRAASDPWRIVTRVLRTRWELGRQ